MICKLACAWNLHSQWDQIPFPGLADPEHRPLFAVLSCEIGGGNGLEPLAIGARMNLPVVDADFMGRAFPELQVRARASTCTLDACGLSVCASTCISIVSTSSRHVPMQRQFISGFFGEEESQKYESLPSLRVSADLSRVKSHPRLLYIYLSHICQGLHCFMFIFLQGMAP